MTQTETLWLVPGDTLILSAKAPGDVDGVRLIEIELDGSHKWVGKSLSRIHLGKRKVSRDDSAGGRIDYSKWKHGVCTG